MHFLNTARYGAFLIATGRAFHSTAAAFGKDLSPHDVNIDYGTVRWRSIDDLSDLVGW